MDFHKMDYDDLFICHSLKLFRFLKANGFWFLTREKDILSTRVIWTFERTPELMKAVTEYTNNKNK